VLRVVEFPHGLSSVYLPDAVADNRAYLDAATAIAERENSELVERLRSRGMDAEGSVEVRTHVAEGILRAAAEGGFDLVAIATHGRGGVRRLVLGSVADKVIRGARLPVLSVRPPN